ncbi:glutathione S-transferase family protein [Ideonella sp.]|uniref:glutathione S-transferase family protein n=1 Tax=Ideonella sp. TaxID=1929293 RepID=UPI002B492789|nr:glutathione S-transferase family protein [Ideonella sp.]HJV68713.1 glutathione S-transferase family protein [Ideonella sp.]
MKLIGMLDSPYVRRVAVSLQLMGLHFEHHNLSVFRTFKEFSAINPVVKAPTLVCDDGEVLMDSSLILDYAEALAEPARRLMPAQLPERQHALHRIGLALAVCEKSVQIIYEHDLRPREKWHAPWLDRVTTQLHAAARLLDDAVGRHPFAAAHIDQAGVSTAIAWHFVQRTLPEVLPAAAFPALAAWSDQAETLPAFRAAPHGDGLVAAAPGA